MFASFKCSEVSVTDSFSNINFYINKSSDGSAKANKNGDGNDPVGTGDKPFRSGPPTMQILAPKSSKEDLLYVLSKTKISLVYIVSYKL